MTKSERGRVPSTSTVVRITNTNDSMKKADSTKAVNKDHEGVKYNKTNKTAPVTLKQTKDTKPKSTTPHTAQAKSANTNNTIPKTIATKSTPTKEEDAQDKKEKDDRVTGQKTKRAQGTDGGPQKRKKGNTKGKEKATTEPIELKIVDDPLNYEALPEDNEYEVESIVSHKVYKSKVINYVIKWSGWDHKDNTTEKASDIHADVPEVCRAYWSKMDPSQILSNVAEFARPGNVNKSAANANLEYRKKTYSQKHIRPRMATNGYTFNSKWPNSTTNWEADMKKITSVLPSVLDEKLLFGYIEWLNGQRTVHFITDLHKHCPERLISYYEDRLRIF